MSQNKLQVPRISDAVAASLERRILEGSLKPGDRLPPERELSLELGVSRPSLREAIQKLASKGMVQSRQGGGCVLPLDRRARAHGQSSPPVERVGVNHAVF